MSNSVYLNEPSIFVEVLCKVLVTLSNLLSTVIPTDGSLHIDGDYLDAQTLLTEIPVVLFVDTFL